MKVVSEICETICKDCDRKHNVKGLLTYWITVPKKNHL